jgi:hypothetical protein
MRPSQVTNSGMHVFQGHGVFFGQMCRSARKIDEVDDAAHKARISTA